MSIPTIISMLITSIYNMADTFFVGKISTQATAAVGVTFSFMSVLQAIGFFFGQGSGTFISRRLGARDSQRALGMASTAFFLAMGTGVALMIAGLLLLRPLSILLGSTPTILPDTVVFLRCILIGAPFMIGSMSLNNQMRFQGNATFAMFGMLSGAIVNIILLPILIFVCKLGILGAGLGTLIGQITGFFVLFAMSRKGENLRISPKNISLCSGYFKEILRGGTPSLTRQGLGAISTILLNVAAGAYGDAAIAGMSIVTRLSFIVMSVVIGLGQGFQPFCGFNYGAKLYPRVKSGFYFSVKVSAAFLVFCALAGFPFAAQIVNVFRADPEVVAVGAVAFRWQIVTYPLISVIMISNMMMQTTGHAVQANILAASRNGLFFIPFILVLPHLFGILGVEICQAVSDICSFVLALPLTSKVLSEMK